MEFRHFYHVYAGGAWATPVREHMAALLQARLRLPMTVGVVGPEDDRYRVQEVMTSALPAFDIDWAEADDGYEEVTLGPLNDWCKANPDAGVLYCHDKGARDDSEWNAIWRRSMTHHCVGRWKFCANLLDGGWDTVGCHWVEVRDRGMFYAGNFWWASAAYAGSLPRLRLYDRFDAENWIGSGQPKAYDMLPGFPDTSLCGPYAR